MSTDTRTRDEVIEEVEALRLGYPDLETGDPFPWVNGRSRTSVPVRLGGEWSRFDPRPWMEYTTWEQKAKEFAAALDDVWCRLVPTADESKYVKEARQVIVNLDAKIRPCLPVPATETNKEKD